MKIYKKNACKKIDNIIIIITLDGTKPSSRIRASDFRQYLKKLIEGKSMKKFLFISLLCSLLISASAGTLKAQNEAEAAAPTVESDLAVLPDDVLEKKKEGWYPTGIPIYNYTSDNGHGFGARAIMYNNGSKDDQYFKNTPYFYQITAQGYATTLGWQYHFVEADMPFFMGSKFRIKTSAVYDKTTNANFFGIGQKNTDKLTDKNDKTYNTYQDYYEQFLVEPNNNPRDFKYDKYGITRPKVFLNGYMNISKEVKVMTGFEVKHTAIDPWGGKKFDLVDEANDVDAKNIPANPTRVEELGLENQDGWVNSATIGIAYDTRDYEPDPKKGIYADYTLTAVSKALGSDYEYQRSTLAARYFFSHPSLNYSGDGGKLKFIPILASRAAVTTITGDEAPFHELGNFNYFLSNQSGLGGNRTLRSYKSNRFIGETMTNANIELRVEFLELSGAGQLFTFKALAFADTGSVFDNRKDVIKDFGYYHSSFGGGLAIAWNQALIIHFYYGVGAEDASISLDIGHAI
jgi:hypothetical protein